MRTLGMLQQRKTMTMHMRMKARLTSPLTEFLALTWAYLTRYFVYNSDKTIFKTDLMPLKILTLKKMREKTGMRQVKKSLNQLI